MSKDSPAKCYQDNKEILPKEATVSLRMIQRSTRR